MDIKIRSANFIYSDQEITHANLNFDTNFNTDININGFVRVTIDEYNQNATDYAGLTEIIKTKLKEQLT